MSPAMIYNLPDVVALLPLAEVAADANGSGVDISSYEGVVKFVAHTKATSGTTPTLGLKLQHSDDDGDADPYVDVSGGAFTQATDADTSAAVLQSLSLQKNALRKYVRVAKDIGGTSTPKFLASVDLVAHTKYPS